MGEKVKKNRKEVMSSSTRRVENGNVINLKIDHKIQVDVEDGRVKGEKMMCRDRVGGQKYVLGCGILSGEQSWALHRQLI